MAGQSIAERCKRAGSQGGKVIRCVRCHGDIPEYAGRSVALLSGQHAHHPGKCTDQAEREAGVRSVAVQTTFGWSCAHVEPGSTEPDICSLAGAERTAYVEHMRAEHGATALKPTVPPIRLRNAVPAAKRQAPAVAPFKRIEWTVTRGPDGGTAANPVLRRGQFWANGPDAHSVIVIEDMRALAMPNRLVTLYIRADGSVTPDWSDAGSSRREANRENKRAAERAGRAA